MDLPKVYVVQSNYTWVFPEGATEIKGTACFIADSLINLRSDFQNILSLAQSLSLFLSTLDGLTIKNTKCERSCGSSHEKNHESSQT